MESGKRSPLPDSAELHPGYLLQTLSPLQTLPRGYSITTDADSVKIITHSSDTAPGAWIYTRLAEGRLVSVVEKCEKNQ